MHAGSGVGYGDTFQSAGSLPSRGTDRHRSPDFFRNSPHAGSPRRAQSILRRMRLLGAMRCAYRTLRVLQRCSRACRRVRSSLVRHRRALARQAPRPATPIGRQSAANPRHKPISTPLLRHTGLKPPVHALSRPAESRMATDAPQIRPHETSGAMLFPRCALPELADPQQTIEAGPRDLARDWRHTDGRSEGWGGGVRRRNTRRDLNPHIPCSDPSP